MKSHDEFLKQMKLEAAPQDVSMPILEDLLSQGYDTARCRVNPSAIDTICLAGDGDVLPLADFIEGGREHNAPAFSARHVGCQCAWIITGPALPDVVVTAFGIQ
jgi:hypothetical protein